MRLHILTMLFLSTQFAGAQKIVQRTVKLPLGNLLHIDARQCYNVNLQTYRNPELSIKALMEGEYEEQVLLEFREEGSTTFIDAGVHPLFKEHNDKLAAHKAVAIALDVYIPQNANVRLLGSSLILTASGKYENLLVLLESGQCTLYDLSGKVEVNTRDADICLMNRDGQITADSKYGSVVADIIPESNSLFQLRTISGNIRLKRME